MTSSGLSSDNSISLLLKSAERSLSFISRPSPPPALSLPPAHEAKFAQLYDQVDAIRSRLEARETTNDENSKLSALCVSLAARIDGLERRLAELSASVDTRLDANLSENLLRMEGLAKAVAKTRHLQQSRN